ncbi:SulP family inorganic anion transporter [Acidovorax sp. NCPPB 4044]|uniref:SulP family inorganic anion transporter n=1 Tax=Acidovorax sp. NCPPB 4044 TaxID=2940490 RepID=UPI0023046B77|nr:SulP family inorganic anion transporter [Acidovorax sp. NCPPB 4044]MDA8521580.1 SulP family inorganic anion transporter [Acidovorax sp. NCPPB 4044]
MTTLPADNTPHRTDASPATANASAPQRPARAGLFSHLRQDLPASLVVFLVALPLCLGIALASGAPLMAGLVSGIVGGLVVGALSGSHLSVSGPAAGLVVIVVTSIATLGGYEAFLVAVVMAGALQWLFGRLGAGNIGACFPTPVIKGMLAAIGLLLIIKQLPVAFGFQSTEHALRFLPSAADGFDAVRHLSGAVTVSAAVTAAGALAILFAWDTAFVKRLPVVGRLPGPLVAVLWGVAYHAAALATEPSAALADEQRVALPQVDSLAGLWSQFATPDWSALANPQVYTVAVTLAFVASLETLLSLEATDRLDPLKRVAPPNRELRAQGVGNMVAGLLGGLPITAVIVRSSANVQAGARTRLSAILHGLLLLASLLFLAEFLEWIPLAALAAVLLHTGYKLAKPSLVMDTWRQGWGVFIPFAVTVAAILATDLLIGILIGLASSMLFVIESNTRGALSMVSEGSVHLLRLNKDVSFFSRATLRGYLARVQEGDALVIDGSDCRFLDRDIRETLEDFIAHAEERGIHVERRSMPGAAPDAGLSGAVGMSGLVALLRPRPRAAATAAR